MRLHEAERIIRGGGKRYLELEAAKAALREELHTAGPRNHGLRARLYYELVRCYLAQDHSGVHNQLSEDFGALCGEMDQEERHYRRMLAEAADPESTTKLRDGLYGFLRSAERSMSSLEALFRRHDLYEREQATYLRKMHYRMERYRMQRKWVAYGMHRILEVTSRFGTDFFRWGVTTAAVVAFFGALMMVLDHFETGGSMIALGKWYDYFYFSVIAFTTAGFGDILPSTGLLKLTVGIEVLLGYVMLGILINLIEKKMR